MRWRRLLVFLTIMCFGASLTLAQNAQEAPKKMKLWEKIAEATIDIKMSRPSFDLPPEVHFSPMYRSGGVQVADITPPIPKNWLNTISIGGNVHPLPLPILNNLSVGYAMDFHPGWSNNFREGDFLSRARYANGEDAFTYTRLSGFGRSQTFRAAYADIPLLKSLGGDIFGIYIDIGPKYTKYSSIEVTQGYDTFNEDRVYRTSSATGKSVGGSLIVKFAYRDEKGRGRFAVRLGVDYEKGHFEFPDFPGRRPFSMLSLGFFGLELGF
jgi:hypothetical protein